MTEAEPVVPREPPGISDEVRSARPPPMPEVPAPWAFRLVNPDADAEMIAEWMSGLHLAEAWESVWPASRWRRYLRAQHEGG